VKWFRLLLGLCIGLSIGSARAQDRLLDTAYDGPFDCTAPAAVTHFKVTLPNTARAIRHGKGLSIVAIGSSSTEGIGATDRSHSYPAQLAAALKRRWPRLAVDVFNKGVGGEDARQMLQRFATDVLPYKPQLVIWQVGSNYTLRNDDFASYAANVRKGINQLKAAHTDVILMDPQYAPKILAKPLHRRMIETMGMLGNDAKVAVFRRFAVMRDWVSSGRHRMEDIISRDHLHMNDASYSCIGRLLADSVATAAAAAMPSSAQGAAAAREELVPPATAIR
jgi:acyl-CoA thioesterase-1